MSEKQTVLEAFANIGKSFDSEEDVERDLEQQVREEIAALEPELREVYRYLRKRGTRWGNGLYHGEVAQALGISQPEALRRLTRLYDRGWLYQHCPPLVWAARERRVRLEGEDEG